MASTTSQCKQWIHAPSGGTRQCTRTATHWLPENHNVTTCTQHARSYDVPMPKAAR